MVLRAQMRVWRNQFGAAPYPVQMRPMRPDILSKKSSADMPEMSRRSATGDCRINQELGPVSPSTRTKLIRVNGKKRRAHRVIMAGVLGRELLPTEDVHHKDKNPLNNDLSNLEVMVKRDHYRMHKQIYPDTKTCAFCGKEYQAPPRKRKASSVCSRSCATKLCWVSRSSSRSKPTRSSKQSSES